MSDLEREISLVSAENRRRSYGCPANSLISTERAILTHRGGEQRKMLENRGRNRGREEEYMNITKQRPHLDCLILQM
jgi:hypothetical protein